MTEERRDYDRAFDRLFQKLDEHSDKLEEHASVIKQNRLDMDCIKRGQDDLTKLVTEHVQEENDTLAVVSNFLRDLKGFDTILRYIAIVGKWLLILGSLTGVVWLWDHLIKFISKVP